MIRNDRIKTRSVATYRLQKQRGISLVLVSILIVVFLTCIAVTLSLGYQARNMAALQSIANSIAVGSLERVLRRPGETMTVRTVAARNWAQEVMRENSLHGSSGNFGASGYDFLKLVDEVFDPQVDAGRVLFGNQYREDPDGAGSMDPCGAGGYPCFVPNENHIDDNTINTVRVDIRNSSNPFVAPLAGLLGINAVRVDAQATATVAQRCTVFLVDMGLSTIRESYLFTALMNPPNDAGVPSVGSLFAFRNSRVDPNKNNTVYDEQTCADPSGPASSPLAPPTPESVYFCSPALDWNGYNGSGWDASNANLFHYRHNYRVMDSSIGKMRIDDYNVGTPVPRPYPYSFFLLGFNSGARLLAEQNTSSDRIAIVGFDRSVTSRRRLPTPDFPQYPSLFASDKMTPDIGRIAMITDMRRMGWHERDGVTDSFPSETEKMPNIVDYGLFPISFILGDNPANGSGTDIVEALDSAIEILATSCPSQQRKRIVMATDGTPTCWHQRGAPSGSGGCPSVNRVVRNGLRVFPDEYYGKYGMEYGDPDNANPPQDTYAGVEHVLLSEQPGGILYDLQRFGISLSVMMRGEYIGPNIKNFTRGFPDRYLTIDEARAESGFAGINFAGSNTPEDHLLFKTSNELPVGFNRKDLIRDFALNKWHTVPPCIDKRNWEDACAFTFAGEVAGVKFRRPIGVFGHLALRSGGQFSPLFNVNPDPSCYDGDHNLKDEFDGRSDCRLGAADGSGPPLEWSLHDHGPGYDAAALVRSAIGSNPYILDELRCEGTDC